MRAVCDKMCFISGAPVVGRQKLLLVPTLWEPQQSLQQLWHFASRKHHVGAAPREGFFSPSPLKIYVFVTSECTRLILKQNRSVKLSNVNMERIPSVFGTSNLILFENLVAVFSLYIVRVRVSAPGSRWPFPPRGGREQKEQREEKRSLSKQKKKKEKKSSIIYNFFS